MKLKKTPAPRRAGTANESMPKWMADELRANPALLEKVAAMVEDHLKRSRSARR